MIRDCNCGKCNKWSLLQVLAAALFIVFVVAALTFSVWAQAPGNGDVPTWSTSLGRWNYQQPGSGSLPSGLIVLTLSPPCPSGFSEVASMNARALIGTLNTNGNAGTTGGSDNITPTGTNSAPTFTGNSSTMVVNHTHTLATGTGATGNFSQVIGTVDASSGGTGGSPTQTALATISGNPAGGAASYTPGGSVSAPTFTGTQFDNRSAFIRVVFCSKD